MKSEFILLLLLIININVWCQEIGGDYSYEDEEIPEPTTTSKSSVITAKTESNSVNIDDDNDEAERRQTENDVIKSQLDSMSNSFRNVVNKIKMKHKRIDMVFLVDSSSSVGKENFENEISFVKRLLSDFNVSFNYTRIALITFSSRSKIVSCNN